MDGKGRICCRILTALMCVTGIYGCVAIDGISETAELQIIIKGGHLTTRSEMPDEEKISDLNLMIFDGHGLLEKHIYMVDGKTSCSVNLLRGTGYSILACANLGYRINAHSLSEAEDICCYLAYPDEYREGIPMAASVHHVIAGERQTVCLDLERIMARISIRMDRSRLKESVQMDVIGIKIGNCPKKARVFRPSRVESHDDCFSLGFRHDDEACNALNKSDKNGLSEELSLYMLENMQGDFRESGIDTDDQKVFMETDSRKDICSFIEIELEYNSKEFASAEKPLIYRFYLGDSLNNLDVERNCHYHITVRPENDGLHGDGWRVDKSGLEFIGITTFFQYPSDYLVGNIGDKIHIGCSFTPSFAPFDVGIEYLKEDKARGIYEYEIDEDGHGVTLTLTGPGRGLIYMEAGAPVNRAALFMIEVNLPKGTLQCKSLHTKEAAPEYRQTQGFHQHLRPPDQGR